MSHTDAVHQQAADTANSKRVQKRSIRNAAWQPFLQFKLLAYMLGSTALVAVLLSIFLYYAFGDLLNIVTIKSESASYYSEMMDVQLVHLLRYCGALIVLYIILLGAVCIAYTHRLTGPLRPFLRHVDNLIDGDYSSRVILRNGDLDIYNEYAEKLNTLAVKLNAEDNDKSADNQNPGNRDDKQPSA